MEVKPTRKSYRAKFSYEPTDPKGVGLSPGDKVTDVVDLGSGWVVCYNKNTGKTGVCPSDFLQKDMATRIRSLSLSKFGNRVSSVSINIANSSGISTKNSLTPGKQLTEDKIILEEKPNDEHVPISPGRRILQILVGLFGGAVLGGLLLVALYYLYGFTFKEAVGVSGAITLFMGLGLIFSQHVRCVAVLMGVSMFTNQGRVALLSLVPGLILTGPIMNMHRNINEGVNSVACVGQVLYNHSYALQQNALEFLVRQQKILEEGERKINEDISNLTTNIYPGASTNKTKIDGNKTKKPTFTLRINSMPQSTATSRFGSGETDWIKVSSPTSLQRFSLSQSSRTSKPSLQGTTIISRTSTITQQKTSLRPIRLSFPQTATKTKASLKSAVVPGIETPLQSAALSSTATTTVPGRTFATIASASQETIRKSSSNLTTKTKGSSTTAISPGKITPSQSPAVSFIVTSMVHRRTFATIDSTSQGTIRTSTSNPKSKSRVKTTTYKETLYPSIKTSINTTSRKKSATTQPSQAPPGAFTGTPIFHERTFATGASASEETISKSTSNPTSKLSENVKSTMYRATLNPSTLSSLETTRGTTTETTQSESTTQLTSTERYVIPPRIPRDLTYHDWKGDRPKYLECVERLQRMKTECQEAVNQSKQKSEDSNTGSRLSFPCKSTCKVLSSTFLCSRLNESICSSSRRSARSVIQSPKQSLGARLKEKLGFRVNLSRVLDISTNNSFNPAEKILEVKKKIQGTMDQVIFIFRLINKILIIFILWALISACLYLRKYLKKVKYDNIYITSGFKNLNSKLRKIEKTKAVLPLEKKEKKKYVDSTSTKPGRAEAFAWTMGITRVVFHIIIAAVFILLDFALFYVLQLIRENGGSDFLVSGGAALDVDIEGVGPLAEFVRNIFASSTASNKFESVLNFDQCLPSASAPSWKPVYTIIALYVMTLLFVLFQSVGLRLRRKISAFFFPQREIERIHYLYRHILLKRRMRAEEKKKLDLLKDKWGPFLEGAGHLQTIEL